jgi:hypothetical protein
MKVFQQRPDSFFLDFMPEEKSFRGAKIYIPLAAPSATSTPAASSQSCSAASSPAASSQSCSAAPAPAASSQSCSAASAPAASSQSIDDQVNDDQVYIDNCRREHSALVTAYKELTAQEFDEHYSLYEEDINNGIQKIEEGKNLVQEIQAKNIADGKANFPKISQIMDIIYKEFDRFRDLQKKGLYKHPRYQELVRSVSFIAKWIITYEAYDHFNLLKQRLLGNNCISSWDDEKVEVSQDLVFYFWKIMDSDVLPFLQKVNSYFPLPKSLKEANDLHSKPCNFSPL